MIINPITSQNIPLYSKEAKYLLKSYIKRYYQKNQTGGSLCNYSLIYMAKPRYGGWVSFTAHLSRKFNLPIYKISKTTEKSQRDFGYGATYQNISIETAKKLKNILITAIDKNYYEYLSQLPKSTSLVIHDPTEVKGASCQPVLDVLHKFKIYTIRKTVQQFLQSTYHVKSQLKLHPFFDFEKQTKSKLKKAVSISRVDYDKHTEIIIEANKILKKKKKPIIDIYGAKNDRYVFYKLQQHDSMKETDKKSAYKGRFDKTFEAIGHILKDSKFVVDMSAIKNDGGGSQYTFLEAIYYDCALILNKQWIESTNSVFIPNKNCFVVETAEELAELLIKNPDTTKIVKEARKLLTPHQKVNWCL